MALESVDINCDLGEAFGRWRVGDTADQALMGLISSANIATGFHAGDPNLMDETVRLAVEHGVGIGAHPGYDDLQGFGRRKINGTPRELVNDIVYQVGALKEFVRRHGASLQHVKPHGALYMEMAVNPELAQLFVHYMRTASPNAYVLCMAGSATEIAAREADSRWRGNSTPTAIMTKAVPSSLPAMPGVPILPPLPEKCCVPVWRARSRR